MIPADNLGDCIRAKRMTASSGSLIFMLICTLEAKKERNLHVRLPLMAKVSSEEGDETAKSSVPFCSDLHCGCKSRYPLFPG